METGNIEYECDRCGERFLTAKYHKFCLEVTDSECKALKLVRVLGNNVCTDVHLCPSCMRALRGWWLD